jgi:hypothetical protein
LGGAALPANRSLWVAQHFQQNRSFWVAQRFQRCDQEAK